MSDRKENQNKNPDPAPVQTDESPVEQSANRIDEFSWRVAQLATSLLSEWAQARQTVPKDWVWEEDHFTGQVDNAVRKARLILDRASNPSLFDYHLYEFFQPGEALNSPEITRRLEDIRWWSTSRPTMDKRLDLIRGDWTAVLDRLKNDFYETQDLSRQMLEELEKTLQEFCNRGGVTEGFPRAVKLSREFLNELHREIDIADEELQSVKYYQYKQLFDWCFIAGDGTEGDRSKRYRFHELLRVAGDHGWLPDEFKTPTGALLSEQRRTPPFYAIPKKASFSEFNNDSATGQLTSYPWVMGVEKPPRIPSRGGV